MTTDTINWVGQTLGGGRYKVAAKLGEGGMGYVYKAHDGNLDTEVVIKVPRGGQEDASKFVARFGREIKALVHLQHPHIVRVMDFGQHEGLPFAVIQHLPGGSLHDRRPMGADQQPVPILWNELGSWLIDVAEALDFIHRQGYVHRDLKPANILFDGHGNVFLSDFGIAKVLGSDETGSPSNNMTAQGMIVGTPEYMAPELVMGQPYDGRVDQYALGVLLYELLAGQRPFTGPTPWAVLVQHKTTEAPVLCEKFPFVPKAVSAAIQRALTKDPQQRFTDCAAFARAVLNPALIADTGGGSAKATSGPGAGPAVATEPGSLRVTCPACMKVFRVKPNLQGKKVRCPTCHAVSIVPAQLAPPATPSPLADTPAPAATPVAAPPLLERAPDENLPLLRGFTDLFLWPALGTLLGANFLAMILPVFAQAFTTIAIGPDQLRWIMIAGGVLGMLLGIVAVSASGVGGNLFRLLVCVLGLALPVLLLYPDILAIKLTEQASVALLVLEALTLVVTFSCWIRLFILWKRQPLPGETSVLVGSQRLQAWLFGLGAVMVLIIVGVMALGLHEPLREAAQKSAGLKWLGDALTAIREAKPVQPTGTNLRTESSDTKPLASTSPLSSERPEKRPATKSGSKPGKKG